MVTQMTKRQYSIVPVSGDGRFVLKVFVMLSSVIVLYLQSRPVYHTQWYGIILLFITKKL